MCSLWATASTKAGTLPSISCHDVRRCGGKRIGPADPITKVRDDEARKGKSARTCEQTGQPKGRHSCLIYYLGYRSDLLSIRTQVSKRIPRTGILEGKGKTRIPIHIRWHAVIE